MSVFSTDVGDNLATPRYNEASIRVLKAGARASARACTPAPRTRCVVVQEVIDNAADEALAGYGKQIQVTRTPMAAYPSRTTAAAYRDCTRKKTRRWLNHASHAGGKFDKQGGGAYAFSGGLHGVGVSVTNALATRLKSWSGATA